jgi:hypothetical protein
MHHPSYRKKSYFWVKIDMIPSCSDNPSTDPRVAPIRSPGYAGYLCYWARRFRASTKCSWHPVVFSLYMLSSINWICIFKDTRGVRDIILIHFAHVGSVGENKRAVVAWVREYRHRNRQIESRSISIPHRRECEFENGYSTSIRRIHSRREQIRVGPKIRSILSMPPEGKVKLAVISNEPETESGYQS